MTDLPLAHFSVLLPEVLSGLELKPGSQVLDGTLGGAGHGEAMLRIIGPEGYLWGIEQDSKVISLAQTRLEKTGFPFRIIHGNFEHLLEYSQSYGFSNLDAILLDLGTSMFQFKSADYGMSFQLDGPLDMRMDSSANVPTAYEMINFWPEQKLEAIFRDFGEERFARKLSQVIGISRRKQMIKTTRELAELIKKHIPFSGKIHPATRIFQALRIAVNRELEVLEKVLPAALSLLRSGGRLAVISFHSLEDRRVKQFFQQEAKICLCPPKQPICTCHHQAQLKILTRKGIAPSVKEIEKNPPSRSARLRIAQKL